MLKVLNRIKVIHIIGLCLIGVIIFLLFRVNNLQNSIDYISQTNDTLITYVNKLDQRVYEIPYVELSSKSIKSLAKIDSAYAVLHKRIIALDKNYKDLQSSITLAFSYKDTATVTKVINNYVTTDSKGNTTEYKTFDFNDGLLSLESTVNSNLDNIYHKYNVTIKNMHVDIFKNKKGFSAIATFDNPNLNLSSYNVYIKSLPKPKYVLSAGIGYGALYDVPNGKFGYGPTVSLMFGKPLWVIYNKTK